jgi:hypothetical protein
MATELDPPLAKTLRALMLISLKGISIDAQVEVLLRAGFSNQEVADFTGSTPGAVAMRKLRLKGRRKAK